MVSKDPETNKGLAYYTNVAINMRKTFYIWTCHNLHQEPIGNLYVPGVSSFKYILALENATQIFGQ